ncbi:hypothetical protein PsYK624_159050 [Phanerochaete sordida]|uniref:Uncharacterized protein n=1 Tax=Phanerochaete sordida TaxID=48140 RepID=A0A9P3GU97_9APHY|nr:hypothetical protein PsYK624_159050 [Phanerochaete sordida]
MLPKSWLTPRANDSALPPEPPPPAALPALGPEDAAKAAPGSARPGLERAVTAALATPHDAVLAELQGRTPRVGSSQLSGPAVTTPAPPAAGPPQPQPQTSPLSSEASPEPVYDPFSGGLAYVLPPRSPEDAAAAAAGGGGFEQSKDELWARLARIRELQSEIAVMHLQMEGVGAGDGRVHRKAHARTPTENILGDEWPDPEEEEADKKRERDSEFANLAQAFAGRHASIDNIMGKLDDLSKALTAFHALPTPTMEFATRNNTKDSVTTMFSSPSPTFTADPGSPGSLFSPTVPPPGQLHAALDKLNIPRTASPDHSPVL